ncbi:sugar ABC transporter substrate-binding protein [Microbacterium sp. NPDC058389]|uniref:sugar ABC transporter substrate-binding protein n=1 Tax=Microbacterium sp. NPDC058389 TaxID=3346475 RepID=UPI00365AC298
MKNTQRRVHTRLVGLAAAALLALPLAACGAAAANSGDGEEAPLKIGVFIPGNNNPYLQAAEKGAKDAGAELGVDVTVVTADWNTQKQNTAFQLALQRDTYDGWVVATITPTDQCSNIKKAEEAGTPVIVTVAAICGDKGYSPGTTGFVSEQSESTYSTWWDAIFAMTPPGPVAFVGGPKLDFPTEAAIAAGRSGLEAHPEFSLVASENTDYSTDAAYKASQAFLQTNRDLTAIASNFSGMTRGVVQAVQQAGRTGDVLVFDSNSDSWTKEQIQSGNITAALPGMPYTDFKVAVTLMVDKLHGKDIPQTTNPLDTLTFPGAPIITKDNVDQWTPEY